MSHDLKFEEQNSSFSETMGLPEKTSVKFVRRLTETLIDQMGDFNDAMIDKFGDVDKANHWKDSATQEEIIEEFRSRGIPSSNTESIKLFLESEEFESMGWELKTPNDYFMVGFLCNVAIKHAEVATKMSERGKASELIEMLDKLTSRKEKKSEPTEEVVSVPKKKQKKVLN